MESLLGAPLGVFLGVTLFLFGGAAWLTGQALAGTWRPAWQAFAYAPLLAAVDRFLIFALFEGELLSLWGYLLHALLLLAIMLLAYRVTRARRMVSQYPWLYERAGLLAWRPARQGPDPDQAPGQDPARSEAQGRLPP